MHVYDEMFHISQLFTQKHTKQTWNTHLSSIDSVSKSVCMFFFCRCFHMLLHTQIFGTSSPECENTSIYCIMSDSGENDDKVSKIYAECKIVTTILWILRLSILHCTVSNALFHLDHTESYADILYSSTEIKWWQISKKYQVMWGEKKSIGFFFMPF